MAMFAVSALAAEHFRALFGSTMCQCQFSGHVQKRYMHTKGRHCVADGAPDLFILNIWDWFGKKV